jgi:hypothetical protein
VITLLLVIVILVKLCWGCFTIEECADAGSVVPTLTTVFSRLMSILVLVSELGRSDVVIIQPLVFLADERSFIGPFGSDNRPLLIWTLIVLLVVLLLICTNWVWDEVTDRNVGWAVVLRKLSIGMEDFIVPRAGAVDDWTLLLLIIIFCWPKLVEVDWSAKGAVWPTDVVAFVVAVEITVDAWCPLLTIDLNVGGNSNECFDTLALFVVIIVLAGILTVIVAGAGATFEFTTTFGSADKAYGFGTRRLLADKTDLCFAKICDMFFEFSPILMSCEDCDVVNLKVRISAALNVVDWNFANEFVDWIGPLIALLLSDVGADIVVVHTFETGVIVADETIIGAVEVVVEVFVL